MQVVAADYTAEDLARQLILGDLSEAQKIARSGVNVNTMLADEFTVLMRVVQAAGADKSRANTLRGLKWLLDQGVDVNAINSHGASALLVAHRAGANQAIELLLGRGAEIASSDLDFEAASIWIDASFLMTILDHYVIDHSANTIEMKLELADLRDYFSKNTQWEIVKNDGRDIFGNKYLLLKTKTSEAQVLTNHETLAELARRGFNIELLAPFVGRRK